MKTGILLVSHANLAKGMKTAAEFVAGEQKQFYAIGLGNSGIESFKTQLRLTLQQLEQDVTKLIIISDIPSGSPGANALVLANETSLPTRVLSGMNLALILEIVLMRELKELDVLVSDAINSSRASITVLDLEVEPNQENDCF